MLQIGMKYPVYRKAYEVRKLWMLIGYVHAYAEAPRIILPRNVVEEMALSLSIFQFHVFG